MSHILVVEDEEHLAQGLAFNLRNAGYDVDVVESGEECLEALEESTFDLILLDVMLPGINGLDVCKAVRREQRLEPIIMVSAKDRVEDAIAGIDAGADDYVTKPFDLEMLLAKVRGSLRRQVWGRTYGNGLSNGGTYENGRAPDTFDYGAWRIDFSTFRAERTSGDRQGEQVELSAKEVGILKLFSERPGEVVSRDTFLEEVWNLPASLETRTVDNFIHKLRQTLEDDPSNPRHIVSVRGVGYRFVP
ncbi:MAG: response regulator transcription factor [Thermoanaerobaculia bacterium]|nr:response regulator transcription factor [Thermoanaerobaculia bacterium]